MGVFTKLWPSQHIILSHGVTMSHKQTEWVSFDSEEPSSSPSTLPLAPSHRIPMVDLANVTSNPTSNYPDTTSNYSDLTSKYPSVTSNVTSKYPDMCSKYPDMCSKYPMTSNVSSKYSVFDSLRHEERCGGYLGWSRELLGLGDTQGA